MTSSTQPDIHSDILSLISRVQEDFPILKHPIHGQRLIYLDNAATTQKPSTVINTLNEYYTKQNANIHRGVHHLSEVATKLFEDTRKSVQTFINAKDVEECIFTRSATEAINLVAYSFGEKYINEGDEILISSLEHHSNIVPWQLLCERKRAILKIIPMNTRGELELDLLPSLLTPKTKLLSITQVSNALGTVIPIAEIIQLAHQRQIPVLIDGAQSAAHLNIDVQALDCDFFTFSGHKLYGPTGVGVLYGKRKWLENMPPYQGGGDMIASCRFEKTIYKEIPYKFEAGTPSIANVIALKPAIDYLLKIGFKTIIEHEKALLDYATQELSKIPDLKIIGTASHKVGVISFLLEGIHPHDIGTILDTHGIAIRSGHHCAMPIMEFYGIPATARISFGIYNTFSDIDQLIDALHQVKRMFKR